MGVRLRTKPLWLYRLSVKEARSSEEGPHATKSSATNINLMRETCKTAAANLNQFSVCRVVFGSNRPRSGPQLVVTALVALWLLFFHILFVFPLFYLWSPRDEWMHAY